MAEEIEVPVEAAQEHISHHAEHSSETWVSLVALSSAIVAVLAAVAALFAGAHSNDAVLSQIHAANEWNYYQAKGIKSDILISKQDLLKGFDKPVLAKDTERADKLSKDKEKSMDRAKGYEEEAERHMKTHETLASAVTFFQVTIAIGAVAVLTKRRRFWYVSLAFCTIGLIFLGLGFRLHFITPDSKVEQAQEAQ